MDIAAKTLTQSAGQALGSIIRKFGNNKDLGYKTYTKMYENYVCPIMDYGSEVWSHQPKARNKVDNVMVIQNRAECYYCGVGKFTPTNSYNLEMNLTPVKV